MGETKWFETWYSKQFKGTDNLLEKDKEGAYIDDMVNAMFIGFSAAWSIK